MRLGLNLKYSLRPVKTARLHKSRARCTAVLLLGLLAACWSSSPLRAAVLLPDPVNILSQPQLAGDCFGCRPVAETHGVVLTVQSISDLLGNTTGGASAATTYSGLVNTALAVDLQKAVGWEGGSFKNTWLWLYGNNGNNLSENIDNALSVSSIAGAPTFRCYELWLQQNALNDAISLRGGLLGLDAEFMIAPTATLFVNGTFGTPALFSMNVPNGGPTYPEATPGVRLAVQPTSWLTLRTAFTQANPFEQHSNLYGFNWNFGPAGGLLNLNEAAATWNSGSPVHQDPSAMRSDGVDSVRGLLGTAKAGFWLQTGQGPSGAEAGEFNFGSPTASAFSSGFYGIIDQQLYAVPGKPSKGLSSFTRAGFSPTATSAPSFYSDGGLVYTGLIPRRDEDRLGVAFGYAKLSDQCVADATTASCPGASFEAVAELSYSIRLTPAIAIQPDIQYILHPGGTQQYGNALVVGFRAVVDF